MAYKFKPTPPTRPGIYEVQWEKSSKIEIVEVAEAEGLLWYFYPDQPFPAYPIKEDDKFTRWRLKKQKDIP